MLSSGDRRIPDSAIGSKHLIPFERRSNRAAERCQAMTGTIEELRRRMEAAAAAMDFEEASRLRDRISLLRGASGDAPAGIDTDGLERQQPGRMGLGTSQQRMTPPAGWKPPRKPDPMTKGHSRPRAKNRS